jgi:hypothetical protein
MLCILTLEQYVTSPVSNLRSVNWLLISVRLYPKAFLIRPINYSKSVNYEYKRTYAYLFIGLLSSVLSHSNYFKNNTLTKNNKILNPKGRISSVRAAEIGFGPRCRRFFGLLYQQGRKDWTSLHLNRKNWTSVAEWLGLGLQGFVCTIDI